MARFAEVIYETGTHSVMSFDSESELVAALNEQHRRAINGEEGGPVGHTAERVKRVLVYSDHPGSEGNSATVSAETLKTLVNGMVKDDGTLDANQLVSAVRDEVSPVYPLAQGRHESQYKADGAEFYHADATWDQGSGNGGNA